MSHLINSTLTLFPTAATLQPPCNSTPPHGKVVVSQQLKTAGREPKQQSARPSRSPSNSCVQKLYCALRRTKSLQSAAGGAIRSIVNVAIDQPCNAKPKSVFKVLTQTKHRARHRHTGLPAKLLASLAIAIASSHSQASSVFINELHYDNDGTDVAEGVEIVALAGHSLDGWQLQFYNGSNGSVYKTVDLAGTIIDQYDGYGISHAATSGLQNGPADGVALIDSAGGVLEFISYEGVVSASEGAAAGMTSFDIGVAEASDLALGMSLQREGTGSFRDDFNWAVASASFGAINGNQNLLPAANSVPLPAGAVLFASALAGLCAARQRQIATRA